MVYIYSLMFISWKHDPAVVDTCIMRPTHY
jgi:hypothetical protein